MPEHEEIKIKGHSYFLNLDSGYIYSREKTLDDNDLHTNIEYHMLFSLIKSLNGLELAMIMTEVKILNA